MGLRPGTRSVTVATADMAEQLRYVHHDVLEYILLPCARPEACLGTRALWFGIVMRVLSSVAMANTRHKCSLIYRNVSPRLRTP